MNAINPSVLAALEFFQQNYAKYSNPSTALNTDNAKEQANAIFHDLANIPYEKYEELPIGVKVYLLKEKPIDNLEKYLNPQIAGILLEREIPDKTKAEACTNQLIEWDEKSQSLTILSSHLVDQASFERLMRSIPEEIVEKAKTLEICEGYAINDLGPILTRFKHLASLKMTNLGQLKSLKGIEILFSTLQELEAKNLSNLKSVEGLSECSLLRKLDLSGASLLDDIRTLTSLENLEELNLNNCYKMKFLKDVVPKLQKLTTLFIKNNLSLKDKTFLKECHNIVQTEV